MSPDNSLDFEVLFHIPAVKSRISEELLARVEEKFNPTGRVPYATEMAYFGQINENILVFGPGTADIAHQPDEWMGIGDVINGAKAFITLAELVNEHRLNRAVPK